MRIRVESIRELYSDEKQTYRLVEADGTICDCWLPGLENPDPLGPLDRGGFESRSDATAFALGVDRERALFGLLPGVTAEDIDAERHQLDGVKEISRRKALDDSVALDRMDDAPQLELDALWDAVTEPTAAVVTHRRRVA